MGEVGGGIGVAEEGSISIRALILVCCLLFVCTRIICIYLYDYTL